MNQHIFSFKANSHILSLLGDELIGSDNLAIFELVKNSYDADASHVKIIFDNINTPEATIYLVFRSVEQPKITRNIQA